MKLARTCSATRHAYNGVRVKPAHPVRIGYTVRALRIVVVTGLLSKRMGASIAARNRRDQSLPPAPPGERAVDHSPTRLPAAEQRVGRRSRAARVTQPAEPGRTDDSRRGAFATAFMSTTSGGHFFDMTGTPPPRGNSLVNDLNRFDRNPKPCQCD